MIEQPLVLGWLLVSHLTADFVLQTDALVVDRHSRQGRRVFRALAVHGAIVAACMVPFIAAFGLPGLAATLLVAISHPLIDLAKARSGAPTAPIDGAPIDGSPAGWTPRPAALFVLDQAIHLAVLYAAWWVFLRDAPLLGGFADGVGGATAGIASADVHHAAVLVILGWTLLVVNVRVAMFLVELLLPHKRALDGLHRGGAAAAASGGPAESYSVRLGPISARIEREGPEIPSARQRDNVGATIGILERLLVVTLMISGATLAIGLVVAAKTLARFKQLDERDFAESYLLGTLASVAIAVASAAAALAVLPAM